jgi:hypothetical protein
MRRPVKVVRRKGQVRREREMIALRYAPSARELFAELRPVLLASRPVLSWIDEGKPGERVVYGRPTFRNVIVDGVLS